jgi:hypothetical protein
VTGIKLSRATATVVEGKSATLRVTHEPKEAPAPTDIVWSSDDVEVVTVAGGKITGVSEGTAMIKAEFGGLMATCEVTVNKDLGQKSLNGSDYYTIAMDRVSFKKIDDLHKVKADYRVDDSRIRFYVHGDPEGSSLVGELCAGTSFYGYAAQNEDYIMTWYKFKVAPDVAWSSGGHTFVDYPDAVDMSGITNAADDYVFHIALRTDAPGPIGFTFNNGSTECGFAIGTASIQKDEDEYWDPYDDIPRGTGEWQEIEIPVSKFPKDFYKYSFTANDVSIFTILAGKQSGALIEYDAAFFYKPALDEE